MTCGFRVLPLLLLAGLCARAFGAESAIAPESAEFFEKQVRPVLAEHCYECHGEKKVKGGLRLDTRAGWQEGGDSGPTLVPGKPDESLLIKAVRYRDPDFEMPPKQRLSDAQIEVLERWVAIGAPDPRTGEAVAKATGMSIEEGREFWAYRAPVKRPAPPVADAAWPRTDIDRFLLAKLEAAGLRPNPDADAATLRRRLAFDLTGLPPTAEEVRAFEREWASASSALPAFEGGTRLEADGGKEQEESGFPITRIADRLLASPDFGERWGRHWLDVARFGESLTLRGDVLHQAWRYRDYVIAAFNEDRPFDQFIREQIAGDLLPWSDPRERERQLVATGFLACGNSNLEEQDKALLRMDVVDEQLDTLGKAFLAQTIGCARCHDHKFDPIPTRDYYALAGILRSTRTLGGDTANRASWLEEALPMDEATRARVEAQEKTLKTLEEQLAAAKTQLETAQAPPELRQPVLPTHVLPGIIVDDSQATAVGAWEKSRRIQRYIGDGYLHDSGERLVEKTLSFNAKLPKPGRYEVRFAYISKDDRATNAQLTVFHADGDNAVKVDQTASPKIQGRWVSLGRFRFEDGGQSFVIVNTKGADGIVTADAVQFIPEEETGSTAKVVAGADEEPAARELRDEVKRLTAELAKAKAEGPRRPKALVVREREEIGDAPIHIRGNLRNLGATVPRGFLQVASLGGAPAIPEKESGRRQMADWIASAENPLTARVIVNRVWNWIFGAGLVRTCDNFGTTGEAPSHPELLDFLAIRFVEEGWSVKWLVREIVRSRAYALSSVDTAAARAIDPENRLLWRAHRRRLDAESLRDAMLAISGELDRERGGTRIPPGITADFGFPQNDLRRSVYLPVFRNSLPEIFETFDFADPSMPTGRRSTTTVAPQALFFLNQPFVHARSLAAARRALSRTEAPNELVDLAFRETAGRLPEEKEREIALRAIASGLPLESALAELYHSLFASIDFRYLH